MFKFALADLPKTAGPFVKELIGGRLDRIAQFNNEVILRDIDNKKAREFFLANRIPFEEC